VFSGIVVVEVRKERTQTANDQDCGLLLGSGVARGVCHGERSAVNRELRGTLKRLLSKF
jgi:hypothetical protein